MELCVLYIYKLKTPALHGDGVNFEHHELHEQKSAEGSPCTPPQLPVMMGKQLFVHPFYFFYSLRFTMRIKQIPSIPCWPDSSEEGAKTGLDYTVFRPSGTKSDLAIAYGHSAGPYLQNELKMTCLTQLT